MQKITIKEKEYFYDEKEIINFTEGLIGLPEMRRAVLIPLPECEPFYWLASVDDEKNRFVVVNPHEVFENYQAPAPGEFVATDDAPESKTLAIVKVSSDWTKTTVNLRAPMFIDHKTKRGAQCVLTESNYELAETLPQF